MTTCGTTEPPTHLNLFQQRKQHVGMDSALVCFVQQHDRVFGQLAIAHYLSQQHAVGHVLRSQQGGCWGQSEEASQHAPR